MKEYDKKACRYQFCVKVWSPEVFICVNLVNWEKSEIYFNLHPSDSVP